MARVYTGVDSTTGVLVYMHSKEDIDFTPEFKAAHPDLLFGYIDTAKTEMDEVRPLDIQLLPTRVRPLGLRTVRRQE